MKGPHQYADGYEQCTVCGVKIPVAELKQGKCIDKDRCDRLKRSIDQALQVKPMQPPQEPQK